MIIDLHTHIFPDKIAENTISFLEAEGNSNAHTDGTACGLRASMKKAGITCSVILPVVTNPSQFDSINRFAVNINETYADEADIRLVSFGGIHPDSDTYRAQLRQIKNMGLKGIKLHPDYQKMFLDDIRYMRLIDYASELGLITSIHAGLDIGLPDPIHCTPLRAKRLLDEVQPENLILAHMGGFQCWDEVEHYLTGRNVYLDLAYVFGKISETQLIRIVRTHGADRIFFATDSPWSSQSADLNLFRNMSFTQEEFDLMLFKNAQAMRII